jgi:RNA-directed DNA polymerase
MKKILLFVLCFIKLHASQSKIVFCKRSFGYIDHFTFQKLWKWACRRHPNKGKKWVKAKYFPHKGKRNWIFEIKHPEKPVTRFLASSTTIRRHSMIKQNANPYDPEWKPYFSIRHSRDLTKKKPYLPECLWEKQGHCCAICNQSIAQANNEVIYFPKDNVALDKTTPLSEARLIHMDCITPMKTGSSNEDFISAPSRVQGNLHARFLEEAVTAR